MALTRTKDAEARLFRSTRKVEEEEMEAFAGAFDALFKIKAKDIPEGQKKIRGYVVPVESLPSDRVTRIVGVSPHPFHIDAHLYSYGESSVVIDFSGFHGGIPAFEKASGVKLADYGRAVSGYGCQFA